MIDPASFNPLTDLDPVLPPAAREAMLDVILAWAALDGALSMWAGQAFGLDPTKAAIALGRTDGASKLLKLARLAASKGDELNAKAIRKLRKSYEEHARIRNSIAHSKCVGVWSEQPSRLVFAAFESSRDGELAVDHIMIEGMKASVLFAKQLEAAALVQANKGGFYQ